MAQHCEKCGSDKIIPDAEVVAHCQGGWTKVNAAFHDKPEALFWKGAHTREIRATICAACGHTELKTTNLRGLWETYQKSLER